jgi:nucleoside-diphosphate-sugar epimerase
VKVLVTGGTGFIGGQLCKALVDNGFEVRVLHRFDNNTAYLKSIGVELVKGDITLPETLAAAFNGCNQVYHLAAYTRIIESYKGETWKVNVEGTRNVLNACVKAGVEKIVFTSSAEVIGPSVFGVMLDENVVADQLTFGLQEHSKLACERLMKEYHKHGLKIVVVSPVQVFGPSTGNSNSLVNSLIRNYINQTKLVVPNHLQNSVNYVYINDVVFGLMRAMEKGFSGEHYIIAGENMSNLQFYNTLEQVTNKHTRLIPVPLFIMKLLAYFYSKKAVAKKQFIYISPENVKKYYANWVFSNTKALRILHVKATPLTNALSVTYKWICEQKLE